MSWFLSPGMLFFAAFGSIPVIIHLLNRQKYKRVAWAAMAFLLAAIKRTHHRLRLENLLLLLARVLVMILLAFALAQPLLEGNPLDALTASDTHLVLALDNSYSMGLTRAGKPTPFETARNLSGQLLASLDASRGDKVSLILMSDSPEAVIAEASMQIDFARKKVVDLELSDNGTSAFKTLELAFASVKGSQNARKEVVIVTDLQRIAWTVEEGEKEKFKTLLGDLGRVPGVTVRLVDVGVDGVGNAGIERLYPGESDKVIVVGEDKQAKFVAELHNWGRDDAHRTLTWYVDGARGESVPAVVPAGGACPVELRHSFAEPGPHYVTAELDADAVLADNRASLALDAKQAVQVLLVNGEPSLETFEDEVIFLKLALNPSLVPEERFGIYDVETVRDIVFTETEVRRYDLVIIANLEMIYEENVANLEAYVKAGGGLLLFLGDRVNRKGYNEGMYKDGKGLLPSELVGVAGDAGHQNQVFHLEQVRFDHPALQFFHLHQSKITDLGVYEYYATRVDKDRPDIRVLARYSDPDASPAIVEKIFGRGKIIMVTTSADLDWNDMIKDQGYLILVDQLAKHLVAQPQGLKNVQVGATLEYFLRADQFARQFNLVTPLQETSSLSPSQQGESGFILSYNQTSRAGVYTLEKPVEPTVGQPENPVLGYFAVNVDPREGDLDRIGEEELRQRFPEFKFLYQREASAEEEEPGADKEKKRPHGSRMWRWLAYTVLALLLVEMLMAQRFGARR